MDGVVGPLEQALIRNFSRILSVGSRCPLRSKIFHAPARHDHGRGDVVLHLHFHGRMKILAQAERAPGAVGVKADAQIAW